MRTVGLKVSLVSVARLGLLSVGLVSAALQGLGAQAQTIVYSPYLLPYTFSTYAGGNAQYSATSTPAIGANCPGSTSLFIENASGDGCMALQSSINGDPHDVRVDPRGVVFYIDNSTTSSGVIHRINPYNFLSSLYLGNFTSCKLSSTASSTTSKYGDGCATTDGVANNSATYTATLTEKSLRGLSAGPSGDLGIASYNDYFAHDIVFTTDIMKLLAGNGATGNSNGTPSGTPGSVLNQARGLGFDPTGSIVYLADTGNNILRMINVLGSAAICPNAPTLPCSSSLTAANTTTVKSVTTGVAANTALLAGPEDAQTDSFGNIYIADFGNNVIRGIYKAGNLPWFPVGATPGFIYTIAGIADTGPGTTFGSQMYDYPADGTTPTVAPTSVAMAIRKLGVDGQNNLYLADSGWNVVWFIDHVTGQMRLIAGRYGTFSATTPAGQPSIGCPANPNPAGSTTNIGDGCPGPDGQLFANTANSDLAVSPDRIGNVYISDAESATYIPANARIRKLLSGTVFPATAMGASVTQSLLVHFGPGDSPSASNGFTLTGTDYAVVGTPTCTVNAPGTFNGGVTGDTTDDCVVTVKFTPTRSGVDNATLTATSTLSATASFVLSGSGTAATLAYDPGNISTFSGTATAAKGIALDGAGNAYIADTGNNQILFVTAAGGTSVFVPASAGLKSPSAVAIGVDGSVFVADTGNNLIRKVTPTGLVSTYGGGATGTCTTPSDGFSDNCLATQATFKAPAGLATDNLGNLYVADTGNNVIRIIASNGFVSAFAGGGTSCNSDPYGNGCGAVSTLFNAPTGLALDPIANYLYVADTGNSLIRRIYLSTTYTSSGTGTATKAANIILNPVTAVAGNGVTGVTVSSSGTATGSNLTNPTGVAVDASGTVYIADTGNSAIRMVASSNGIITTIAGTLGTSGNKPAGSSASITASGYTTTCSTNATTVTLTAINNFTAGLGVTFSGLTNAAFLNGQNLPVLAAGLSNTQFEVNIPGVLACPPGSGTTYTSAPAADTGTASYSTSATSIQLASPSAVAVTPAGNLVIADTGNSRLLLDARSQISYNFGPIAVSNPATSSSPQPFTVTNIGSSATTINAFTTKSANTAFTLTGAGTSTGVPACPSSSNTAYAAGSICNVNAVFAPTTVGLQSATFTDTNGPVTATPSLTLIGTGAGALTSTTATVTQTSPASGDPQFSGTFTVKATITANSCNTFAPSCNPSGTVQFTVDNAASGAPVAVSPVSSPANSSAVSINLVGLTVGTHSIACIFKADSSDDGYYAGSTCPTISVTVDRGGTSSVLSIAPGTNNQPQYPVRPQYPNTNYPTCSYLAKTMLYTCTDTTLTATVSATTAGTPTGTVTFNVTPAGSTTPMALATVTLSTSGSNAVASYAMNYVVDSNGSIVSDASLPPGTYTLSCVYNGDSNYATSTCPGQTFIVLAEPSTLTLTARPCVPSQLYPSGTSTPQFSQNCPNPAPQVNGLPTVAIAQGSTTDVTLFVTPANTFNGTVTFSCNGMPANSVCTFSPQTLSFTSSTSYNTPQYTDVTLWTDIPPGVTPTKAELLLPAHGGPVTSFALLLGWPLALLGLVGLLRFRRAGRMRGLTLMSLLLLMVGSTLTLSGCGGPGIYHPNLTPTGTYLVTITATGAGTTQTTAVEFTVTPGIAGQE